MTRTITRLFDSRAEAERAVEALEQRGLDHDRVSIVASQGGRDGETRTEGRGGLFDRSTGGDGNRDGENDVLDGGGKGAAAGGALGAGAGLLAGLGILAVPGLGAVAAAGWLTSMLVGAAAGAGVGLAAGGLLGALKEAGHSEEEAHVYAEGVRRGGTLVSVRADDDEAADIEAILDGASGVDAMTRGEAYRAEGWTGFDADADPYASDLAGDREGYAERPSFAGGDDTDSNLAAERDHDDRNRQAGVRPDRQI